MIWKIVQSWLFVVTSVVWAQAPDRVGHWAEEPVEWRLSGPGGGGCVTSLLESRHSTNRLFVTSDVGGVYVSNDGGRTYEVRNHKLKDMYGLCVAEHPTDVNTVYLGMRGSLYRSHDGGRSWEELCRGFPDKSGGHYSLEVGTIRVDEQNPDVIYVADRLPHAKGGALYKSEDGGDSWTDVVAYQALPKDSGIRDLVVSRKSSGRLMLSTTKGVFISDDGGGCWRQSNQGLPHPERVLRLAESPNDPNRVYATIHQPAGEAVWSAGVYRSDDGGLSWKAVNGGLLKSPAKQGQSDMFAHWLEHIRVHPLNPDVVWAGGRSWVNGGVWKTDNGGESWRRVMKPPVPEGWITFWGVTVFSMSVSPVDPDIISIGTAGHVFRSVDGGQTWGNVYSEALSDGRFRGNGLENTCLHSIDPDPFVAGRFYCGFYDVGLLITDDGGISYRRCMEGIPSRYSNGCYAVRVDPEAPGHLWGAFGQWGGDPKGCIAESHDGGATWIVLEDSDHHVKGTPKCLNLIGSTAPYSLFFCTEDAGIAASYDSGRSWLLVGEECFPDARRVNAVDVSDGVLYAAVSCDECRPGGVWCSKDCGRNWEQLTSNSMCIGKTTALDVHGNRIVLSARGDRSKSRGYRYGGVWLSEDAGKSWRHILNDRFVSAVGIFGDRILACPFDHPYHDHSGGGGILSTRDGGRRWTTLNSKTLCNPLIECLCADPYHPDMLWAGTCGNGILIGRLAK